jgi:hypothetical protein
MIEVKCYRGSGDKEMDSIEDPLIISDAMAVIRGTYEIDNQYFFVHEQSIEVPHKKTDNSEALMDGDLIDISDKNFGVSGNRLVKKISIIITPDNIFNRIDLVKFEEEIL